MVKVIIQRVEKASVSIHSMLVSSIEKGAVIFIGFCQEDTEEDTLWMAKKVASLRYFQDHSGKTNVSIQDICGQLLIVSQFTLYAECEKGRRPSLMAAAPPEIAYPLYNFFIEEVKKEVSEVYCGIFGADMRVHLINDGPLTLVIEK